MCNLDVKEVHDVLDAVEQKLMVELLENYEGLLLDVGSPYVNKIRRLIDAIKNYV